MDESWQLSELQLAVMRVLWTRPEASVAEVHEALASERTLAVTTVATLLTRLEKRGLLQHRSHGRQYLYRAVVSEEQVRESMVSSLTRNLFRGDVTSLVCHLLHDGDVAPGDLARIRDLLEERRDEGGGHGGD